MSKKSIQLCGLLAAVTMLLTGCGAGMAGSGGGADGNSVGDTAVGATADTDSQGIAKDSEIAHFLGMGESSKFPTRMPDFTAEDLNGNTVTESIFADKDLTVVNIWGTFCTPCVEEMPELGEWAKELPDNVQIIGLVCDIEGDEDTEHRDLALEITDKAGADFLQIVVNQDFYDIMQWIVGVPTTLFVDSEGNIVGEPIIGADVDGYKRFVEEYK